MATVFSVIGRSETGKTTLITELVRELKSRGISVGVMKHCPRGFDLDVEGKDSWRFREAGADAVFLLSPGTLGMIKDVGNKLTLAQITDGFLRNLDLVITEGYPDGARGRKIEVLRSSISQELLSPPDQLTAVVADFHVGIGLPQFGHEDVVRIADFMVGHMQEEVRHVELKVNGKDVDLNPFVQTIFTNTIMGLVSSLRIKEEPKRVELSISVEGS